MKGGRIRRAAIVRAWRRPEGDSEGGWGGALEKDEDGCEGGEVESLRPSNTGLSRRDPT